MYFNLEKSCPKKQPYKSLTDTVRITYKSRTKALQNRFVCRHHADISRRLRDGVFSSLPFCKPILLCCHIAVGCKPVLLAGSSL